MMSLSRVNWPKLELESDKYDPRQREMYNSLFKRPTNTRESDWYERKRKGKRKKSWKDYQWDE